MFKNESFEVVNHLVNMVLRQISLILTGDITDPVTIMAVFFTFEELPSDAQDFVLDNIYVPKDKIAKVSITDMAKMRECLLSHKS